MLVPTLLEVGTEDQRRQWIGPTIRGDVIWCQGYSEPGSGSDLAAASTRAVLDGDDFVVNGQKIWTSSAHYADMMFLLCRTEPEPAEARGAVVPAAVDANAGHRDAAAEDDDRAQRVQRGVFYRCARAREADRAGTRQGLVCREHHSEARTADDRRRRAS